MAYKNGTYVAFNGMGTTDPTKSDMKYYGLLQSWNESSKIDFSFSDSHEKTYSVRDSSELETLKSRLRERLGNSKVFLLIATDQASINRGLLNWEIERAVETYELPIIVCYPGYSKIQHPNKHRSKWPSKLREYIDNDEVKTIHVPFKKGLIAQALDDFSISSPPKYADGVYNESVYKKFGL